MAFAINFFTARQYTMSLVPCMLSDFPWHQRVNEKVVVFRFIFLCEWAYESFLCVEFMIKGTIFSRVENPYRILGKVNETDKNNVVTKGHYRAAGLSVLTHLVWLSYKYQHLAVYPSLFSFLDLHTRTLTFYTM